MQWIIYYCCFQYYNFVYFNALALRKCQELHLGVGHGGNAGACHAALRNHQGPADQRALRVHPLQWLPQVLPHHPARGGAAHLLQRYYSAQLGTFSPLIGYGLQNSLQFGFNRFFRKALSFLNGGVETTTTLFLAGILTGIPSALAITPADHMRILMQKQNHGSLEQYSGEFSAAKDILSRHGPKGLYLGFSTTLLREFFAMSIYFTAFEELKKLLRYDSQGGLGEKMKIMLAGALSGLGSWIFPYPIDFVKTKMQSENLDGRKYRNSWHCFLQNHAEHGWRGFTRGLWTVCLRSIPVNSMAFLVEEETANLLGRKHVSEW